MDKRIINLTLQKWENIRQAIEKNIDWLWQEPELPLMEYKSSEYLCEWAREHGFHVTKPAGSLPTAFTASYGNQDSPCICVLAEYDAMPGLCNQAVPYRKPTDQIAGHGCGHNQIGAVNTGAAIAARYAMEALELDGKILLVGCPAEEIVYGKLVLLGAGLFEGVDVIITSHGDRQNGAISRPCQSVVESEFIFSGISAHTGAPRKYNALEAAELAVQTFERLRGHYFADGSAEHIFRASGIMPSITPDETRLWIVARHANFERAVEIYEFIKSICRETAKITGTKLKELFIAASHGYLPNDTLGQLLFRNLKIVGPPQWRNSDLAWMKKLSKNFEPNNSLDMDQGINIYTEGVDPYGQDDGELSWHIPLSRFNWAVPKYIPFHNWATTALSGSKAGNAGALMASQAITLSVIDLLTNQHIIDKSREELKTRVAGINLDPPRYGKNRVFTKNPKSFWDATWR